jgi:hypothetical protein
MITVDSDANNQSNSLSFEQTNHLLAMSSGMEEGMAKLAINRN